MEIGQHSLNNLLDYEQRQPRIKEHKCQQQQQIKEQQTCSEQQQQSQTQPKQQQQQQQIKEQPSRQHQRRHPSLKHQISSVGLCTELLICFFLVQLILLYLHCKLCSIALTKTENFLEIYFKNNKNK
jgi:hypothetical protein